MKNLSKCSFLGLLILNGGLLASGTVVKTYQVEKRACIQSLQALSPKIYACKFQEGQAKTLLHGDDLLFREDICLLKVKAFSNGYEVRVERIYNSKDHTLSRSKAESCILKGIPNNLQLNALIVQ